MTRRRRLARWSTGLALACLLTYPTVLAVLQMADLLSQALGNEGRPKVYVHLHTDAKSAALEAILKDRLKGLDVTVFGRFQDFEEAFSRNRPDAILGRQVLLSKQKTAIALQGTRDNSDREPYVLVSNGSALEGPLAGRVIGVVDLIGRAGTQEYFGKLLGADVKLKRVTKREDLLPLLQFAAAEAILVPAGAVKSLTERSRMPLRTRILNEAQVGLPAVGLRTDANRESIIRQFAALDSETNRLLGVDSWAAP